MSLDLCLLDEAQCVDSPFVRVYIRVRIGNEWLFVGIGYRVLLVSQGILTMTVSYYT